MINSLPIIENMDKINDNVLNFKLREGLSAETSGGLFVMVPPEALKDFQ